MTERSELTCDHCLLEIPENKSIVDTLKGEEKVFCCRGCRAIYRLINEEGLEEFYHRRESEWMPGPAGDINIELPAFSGSVRQVGDEREGDIIIDGIRCASCIWLVEKVLLRTGGVTGASLNYATHRARIRWDPEDIGLEDILKRIAAIGYRPRPFIAGAFREQIDAEQRDLLLRFGTAAFFSMQLMLYSVSMYAGYFQGIGKGTKIFFQVIALLLTTPVLFYSGMPFIRGAARGLKNVSLNMDVLVMTGAGSAYLYSIFQILSGGEVYFDTAAMIITLILLGRYIETGAKERASSVITGLLALNPKEARKIVRSQKSEVRSKDLQSSEKTMTAISSLHPGDMIQVLPGERIPLDGNVVEGSSEVDESMLTGEPRPVFKSAGSDVFCGTQNLYGQIIFEVVRTGEDTVLSGIVRAVEDAQTRRAPIQTLADRVIGIFVPGVLLLSMATGVTWFLHGTSLSHAVMNAVSVLVIACPCALGLATPLAVLIGTTRGALKGIVIKGGDVIERAGDIDTVVLDKTGTITEGKPLLQSFMGIGISDAEALRLASCLERLSEHSIGKAIIQYAAGSSSCLVSNFAAHPGKGVEGDIEGKRVRVGSRRFMEEKGILRNIKQSVNPGTVPLQFGQEWSGATVVFLSIDQAVCGVFTISDRVREEAGEAVALLKKMGHDVIMMSGDTLQAAYVTGQNLGLPPEKVMGGMSPSEKAEAIKRMQEEKGNVLMAGDGINDAPALVQADVGIAMGRATDIALESADMVLMRSDLRLIPEAVRLSNKTYAIIRQNLFWAFSYNVAALPLAVLGMLHPVVAASAMALSSLCVVGNSMRLTRG